MELKEKVKKLPSTPGVYLYKDSQGGILYVGKAKNLKRRVSSYFQNSKTHSPKVEKLVKHLKDFEFILTDTEFEAFMLECQLIKQIKPIYNKKMKTPQAYTYIGIQRDKKYPKLIITNNPRENNCQIYFGPYTGKGVVERALQGLKEYFKIVCNHPTQKKSACLNHSIGLCLGMCLGGPAVEEYKTIVSRVAALLDGSNLGILDELKQKMLTAAEKFDFEAAAKYRDYLDALNFLYTKEKVIGFTEENHNLAIIEPLDDRKVKLFLIKGNKVLFSEKYLLNKRGNKQVCTKIRKNIFRCFTAALQTNLEVGSDELDEAQIIYNYLQGSNCRYVAIPVEWLDAGESGELDEALNELLGQFKTFNAEDAEKTGTRGI